MQKIGRWPGVVLFILALLSFGSTPQKPENIAQGDYGSVKEYLSAWIPQQMKKARVTGLSIALVDDQEIIWAEGFGWADQKKKIPATAETVYRVGSISKLFTALAVMQLAEQKKIDIDQPLQTYLPEFSLKTRFPEAGPITPRNIMTHHSGIPSDRFKGNMVSDPVSLGELVEEIKDEEAVAPPNQVMMYSNLGPALLGRMVEKVSGQDFADYVDDNILRPLGMMHSSFKLSPEVQALFAKGYHAGKETDSLFFRDYPSISLYANVADLSRFMQMVFAEGRSGDRQILKPETLAEMLRVQNGEVPLDLDNKMGLGWFRTDVPFGGARPLTYAGRVASHGGAAYLYYASLITLPDHKLGVVVLANSNASQGLVAQAAIEALKMALQAKTGLKEPEPEKPSPVIASSPEGLEKYEGHYNIGEDIAGGVMTIRVQGNRLHARIKGETLEFIPHANGNYSVRQLIADFIPVQPKRFKTIQCSFQEIAGYQTLILHRGDSRFLWGEKLEPVPIPEAWRKREGRWEVVNAGEDGTVLQNFRIKIEDNLLIAHVRAVSTLIGKWNYSVALAPVSDTEAIVMGLGKNKGETIHAIMSNGEERIRYSGYEFRRK